ncbi:MAG: TIGR02996 domain-containing protein [Myxococcales bacterium]
MTTPLEAARSALREGSLERTLDHLLAAWREKRDGRLASLVDGVSRELTASLPPLVMKPLAAQWQQWCAVADLQRSADLDRLLAVPLPRKWTEAEPLLEHLYRWPHDPRLARGLAEIVANDTVYSKAGDNRADQVLSFYHRLMGHLVALRDPRALGALESDKETKALPYSSWRNMRGEFAARLRALPAAALTEDEASLVDEMSSRYAGEAARAAKSATTAEELLAQIYADPDDLSARAVYGDWLSERGDPRGEFVALQLARERHPAREALLLKRHGRQWGGPLDGLFDLTHRVFEGGLLAGGRLANDYQRRAIAPEALAEPAWRVITTLELPLSYDLEALFHPNLAWVRRLELTEADVLKLLGRSWPLQELVLDHWAATPMPSPHPLAQAAAFPELPDAGRQRHPRRERPGLARVAPHRARAEAARARGPRHLPFERGALVAADVALARPRAGRRQPARLAAHFHPRLARRTRAAHVEAPLPAGHEGFGHRVRNGEHARGPAAGRAHRARRREDHHHVQAAARVRGARGGALPGAEDRPASLVTRDLNCSPG